MIISLPGVPSEMEYLLENAILPYLRQHYQLTGIIKARLIHTAGVGESLIDERIGDLETLSNPTVGLAAHSGQVDVRITAKADSEAKPTQMIQTIEQELRNRLGDWIYGVDQETLEEAALRALQSRGWTLAVVEFNSAVGLVNRLSSPQAAKLGLLAQVFKGGEVAIPLTSAADMAAQVAACRLSRQVDVCLGVAIFPSGEKQDVAPGLDHAGRGAGDRATLWRSAGIRPALGHPPCAGYLEENGKMKNADYLLKNAACSPWTSNSTNTSRARWQWPATASWRSVRSSRSSSNTRRKRPSTAAGKC